MGSLSGRVAIVTGAGSVAAGIGNGPRSCSPVKTPSSGSSISRRNPPRRLRRWSRRKAPSRSSSRPTYRTPASCQKAVTEITGTLGDPSVLVNNVGIVGARGSAPDVDPDEWDEAMRVNVKSVMLMSKYAVPHIKSAGGGSIVNIASIAGLRGGHPSLAYPTSKGAVVNMTRAMAYHHGPDGIRVNCVAPGLIYTPRVEARSADPAIRTARRMQSPLQTEGDAWDVAAAVPISSAIGAVGIGARP